MAIIKPFKALKPKKKLAEKIASGLLNILKIFFWGFWFSLPLLTLAQKSDGLFKASLSGGPFSIGHDKKGVWFATSFEKKLSSTSTKTFYRKLSIGGELYFENDADSATVINPTAQQFMHETINHESNTGLVAKLIYYPFGGFMRGFHVAAGPLIVYSLRTYEKRAQLIQYSPTLSIRMSEMTSDRKLLAGYRITAGYDIYFSKYCLAGIRADFLQYHDRDLNSLLGLKVGYRF